VNSVDFKVRQKTEGDAADCTLGGKLFQTHAAATGNVGVHCSTSSEYLAQVRISRSSGTKEHIIRV